MEGVAELDIDIHFCGLCYAPVQLQTCNNLHVFLYRWLSASS